MRGKLGSRAVIGAVFAVAAVVAIVAPVGASGGDDATKPYPTRQLSIMAPAASGDDFGVFFGRPLTVGLLIVAVAAFIVPHLGVLRGRTFSDED
jgi:hypothetical protein